MSNTLIAKNNSGSTQSFLGTILSNGDTQQISDFYSPDEIQKADDLNALILSGDIIINDGVSDLSISEAQTATQVPIVSQAAAELGTSDQVFSWTPERVKQAIDANSAIIGNQPFITVRSSDVTSSITQSSKLLIGWDIEDQKDSGFTHSTSINAQRIEVDEDASYFITGSVRVFATAQRFQSLIYIRLNGTELSNYPMGSSYIRGSGNSTDYWNCVINPPPLKLSAGDYIEISIEIESELTVSYSGTLQGPESQLSVIKMSGAKGDKGDTGTGSNIIIEDNGSQVGTLTNTLNFEGVGVESVVDEGGNKTTVNISGLDVLQTCTLDGSSNIITPAQLTSDQDNYNPPGFGSCNLIRQDINGQRIITGFVAPAAGVNRVFAITNISGSSELKFKNNDSSSTAANRILLRDNGPDKGIKENETAVFYYDHTSNRWRVYNRVG